MLSDANRPAQGPRRRPGDSTYASFPVAAPQEGHRAIEMIVRHVLRRGRAESPLAGRILADAQRLVEFGICEPDPREIAQALASPISAWIRGAPGRQRDQALLDTVQ